MGSGSPTLQEKDSNGEGESEVYEKMGETMGIHTLDTIYTPTTKKIEICGTEKTESKNGPSGKGIKEECIACVYNDGEGHLHR